MYVDSSTFLQCYKRCINTVLTNIIGYKATGWYRHFPVNNIRYTDLILNVTSSLRLVVID